MKPTSIDNPGASNTAPSPRLMTLEEWAALEKDEPGELLDGRLEEEEEADYVHEVVVTFLIELFRRWARPSGGFVGGSEAKFAVMNGRGRKPDVTVFFAGRKPPARGLIDMPPDIAVEVVSPTPRDGRRDRVIKPDDYAAFGVRYYWIVDPVFQSLEIFQLDDQNRYVRVLGATTGQIETVPGCPGLCLPLDALWSEVQELSKGSHE